MSSLRRALFPSSPSLLLFLSFFLLPLITRLTTATGVCYYPDGEEAVTDEPCYPDSEISFCCGFNYTCTSNMLCLGTGGGEFPVNRGSCTDQDWSSPSCPQFCISSENEGGGGGLTYCGDNEYCCVSSEVDDCCTLTSSLFQMAAATNFTTIGISSTSTSTPVTTTSSPITTSSSSFTTTTSSTQSTTGVTSTGTGTGIASPTASSESSDDDGGDGGLSTGAKIGLGVGIPVAVIGAFALGYFAFRKCHNRAEASPAVGTPGTGAGSEWQGSQFGFDDKMQQQQQQSGMVSSWNSPAQAQYQALPTHTQNPVELSAGSRSAELPG